MHANSCLLACRNMITAVLGGGKNPNLFFWFLFALAAFSNINMDITLVVRKTTVEVISREREREHGDWDIAFNGYLPTIIVSYPVDTSDHKGKSQ